MKKKKNDLLQLFGDYRFNSILVKNFFVVLITLLVTFMGLSLLVSRQMDVILTREVATINENSLNQTKERIDTLMNEVAQISGQMSLDDDIMMYLLSGSDGKMEKEIMYPAMERIKMYAGIFEYIDSIYVYSNKSRYVLTSSGGDKLDDFEDTTWYANLTERVYEPSRMISRLKNGTYPVLLSYIQPIRLTQMQFLGGIIVNIDVDKLDEQFGTENEELLLIVDDRDNVIFSTMEEYQMQKWYDLDYAAVSNEVGSNAEIVEFDGVEYMRNSMHSQDFSWRYVSIVPMGIYRQYQSSYGTFFMRMTLLIVVLSVVAATFISIYSYMPVRNILNLLKNPDMYGDKESIEKNFRQNEVHEITGNIVRNFYSNREMQKELEDYLHIVDNAQLTALQAQISPHFLYNTLENIRWRAMDICKGDNEVSQIIMNLSEMLRISLDNSQQIISLADEIKNARLYIEILQLRYEDKLQVEWDVDLALEKCQIVKVSLQPLIENAVYHGIKPKRGKGTIRISASALGNRVRIQVQDDGIGMPKEECELLNQDLKENYIMREGHIGVRNVGQRLKLILGEDASIFIASEAGEGTIVTMEVPLKYMEAGMI